MSVFNDQVFLSVSFEITFPLVNQEQNEMNNKMVHARM